MNSKQPVNCLSSSSHFHFLFYCVAIFLTFITISASYSGGNETDYHALLKIKSMITKDPYGALTSWNHSLDFCDWAGITCGKRHRRVTSLRLLSQGLEGFLSPHVGNLSFLRILVLYNNSFQGAIPHEVGRLSKLRLLSLYKNKFNAVIPVNISGCSNLEKLDLSNNELVGSIPKDISFLSKLTFLSLGGNKLTSGILPFLGNLTSMEKFGVVNNPLGGSIPDTLGYWKNLKLFDVGICNLYGIIPHSIFNLSLLTTTSLPYNQLIGSLPPTIGAKFRHLAFFDLHGNQLTGPLPPSISNCSRLGFLDVGENKFSGKLAVDFSKLRDIYFIRLAKNLFGSTGDDEMKFIDSLKNSTRLEKLGLDNCKFQGLLPRSIGNLSNQLSSLHLSANQLHGNIPRSIGNLVGLQVLNLGGNHFTGNIPSTIGNLQKLQVIYLNDNQLLGKIPDAIGNLSLLIKLYLSSNILEGVIPSSLKNCHSLLELRLSNNKLSGEIPTQLLQLSSLSILLDFSHNNLCGSLPIEVGDLNTLSLLDLSYNNLSGDIPSSLGGCVSLLGLSLRGNSFQGMIPLSLSSLKGLMVLDISLNNLSGQIPRFFERFSLENLDISFNNFDGEVPILGVFVNASAFSFYGNSKLCGGIVELGLPKCKNPINIKRKFHVFMIAILTASTLFTIICLAYVWCKRKRKSQLAQSSASEQRRKVSYNQLLKATDGFSEANLIGKGGSGSVYKGILDEENDKFVAVKVLHLQNRGAQRSFMRECEVWRNIRHRNLLKIITSCSSVDFQGNDFKALVYEFMPNGSLHDWLHSSERTSRLNLLQIINILMDVAYALDYIHNQCVPVIVHGDLKPSNILLDDDMVAHVGDFGLARFFGISYPHNSTGIRGTIGYAAPEYGLGNEMTSSGDVYGFGILLLEVMTGKNPTANIFNEGLNLHKFASAALQDHVTDVIDVNILNVHLEDEMFKQNNEANANKIEECLALTIKIGVSCSLESPQQRMDMKDAVYELQHVLHILQNI